MALLAETLVEEWLNRQGWFTIRGIRVGVDEIDLLAIRRTAGGGIEARHLEVQASFRPNKYLTQLTKQIAARMGKQRGSAVKRSQVEVVECAKSWVNTKFRNKRKKECRDALWPSANWTYILVHAVVKYPEELDAIRNEGVELISLESVLHDLCPTERPEFTAGAGADLADLIDYYGREKSLDSMPENADTDENGSEFTE